MQIMCFVRVTPLKFSQKLPLIWLRDGNCIILCTCLRQFRETDQKLLHVKQFSLDFVCTHYIQKLLI